MKNILLVFALLDGAKEEQMQEFLEEIQLMKQIGYHLNILNLLACCTMTSPMFLVVEFAKNGDLLRYLRKRRQQVKRIWPVSFRKPVYLNKLCCLLI